jgi:single-strand DNA-binding protein
MEKVDTMSVGEVVVTVQGRIGSDVEFKSAENGGMGLAVFRLGSTARFYHRGENRWKDRPTTWFTVECWRTLAENAGKSLRKGQPVIVTGRLKTSEWTSGEGEAKSKTVLDAFTIGHDLARGTAVFTKNPPQQQEDQGSGSASDEMRQLVERVETSAVVDLDSLDEDGETAPYVVSGDRKAA